MERDGVRQMGFIISPHMKEGVTVRGNCLGDGTREQTAHEILRTVGRRFYFLPNVRGKSSRV